MCNTCAHWFGLSSMKMEWFMPYLNHVITSRNENQIRKYKKKSVLDTEHNWNCKGESFLGTVVGIHVVTY
jgi:hypothetical protein